ncbi:PQQ-dependent sugar dehydrogenase [Paenibacillus thalictri]|uniref:Sorbosone dehydrogenase family protein n=1 Tax=Paenibacillus thalictri TaxID=2527873 RepID=A0A4Q9DK44_9BACL|nr:sorbosone dehydrogenase family protein [Paenibacillus thalictri]TBL73938.1 sorbosone dehydrogenase family protein [Paenibacillus thalictri]
MMQTFYSLLMLTMLLLTACSGPQQANPTKEAASLETPPAPAQAPAPVSALVPAAVQVPARYQSAYPGGDRKLQLPPGFTIQVFAAGLQGPRHMAIGPDGAVYVAEMSANRVSRLADADGDGVADSSEIYASNMERAHGVEWHQGALYVGAIDGIYRFDGKGVRGEKLVDLPASGSHITRTVRFGQDGRMYVTIGSTCNVCKEEDAHRAAMWVYNADGSGGRLFARGLRNTVDFAFHPQTGAIFGADNGRDSLGDDLPPEELNLIRDGGDYGWPVCHGGQISDPQFGQPDSCSTTVAPALKMQAHSAPLGVQFYSGTQFPAAYQGRLFITFHGSWNRSERTGYKVVSVPFQNGEPSGQPEDFLTGWLTGSGAWGRPVGVLRTPDGALLISDDQGGVIYRVSYQ